MSNSRADASGAASKFDLLPDTIHRPGEQSAALHTFLLHLSSGRDNQVEFFSLKTLSGRKADPDVTAALVFKRKEK
jgi:hypothetical protein